MLAFIEHRPGASTSGTWFNFFLLFHLKDTHHNERNVVIDMAETVPGGEVSTQQGGGPVGSPGNLEGGEDELERDNNVGITVSYSGVDTGIFRVK